MQPVREGVDHAAVFDGVPLGRGLIVLGIEVMATGDDFTRGHESFLVQFGSGGLDDDFVGVADVFEIAHQCEGNEAVLVVRTLIHRILDLVAHGADDFEIKSSDFDVLPGAGRSLKNFLRGFVAENDDTAMIGEVAFIEVTSLGKRELAHLPIGHVDAAHQDGDNAGADLESEVAVDFAADRANQRNFVADGFDVLEFVRNFLSGALTAGLHAGLSGPKDDDVVSHVQEGVQNASAEALAVGKQKHNGDQAPADAEHGQRGARAVAHQSLPALRDEFFQEHGFQGLGARGQGPGARGQ